MTPDEYAAIGRRVAAGEGASTIAGADRAALWELTQLLIDWSLELDPHYFEACDDREAAVAALLESLGGTE